MMFEVYPNMFAAFCGLAVQFQASGAKAQAEPAYATPGFVLNHARNFCTANNVCLWI
jgi:hypothetical protein